MVNISSWYEKQFRERVMFVEFFGFGQPFYRGQCILILNSAFLTR